MTLFSDNVIYEFRYRFIFHQVDVFEVTQIAGIATFGVFAMVWATKKKLSLHFFVHGDF